jgi:hypothetical protein
VIQIHVVSHCDCCGLKVCKRCAGCHSVNCDNHVSFCAALRSEKQNRRRSSLRGAQRRLRRKLRIA